MNFFELPIEWQDRLTSERKALSGKNHNDAYEVRMYNEAGTRYFIARRVCHAWNDDKGHHMNFGGGTHWTIRYGAVQFRAHRNPCGGTDYELSDGKTYNRSANGTEIPARVATKKEVMDILNKIGIF